MSDEGASAVEYAVLTALIAAVIASVVAVLGGDVLAFYLSADWWP